MLTDFGEPLDEFLKPALAAFSPELLMQWFEQHGLPLMQTADGKVFPRSERASDVVHCFQDTLRRSNVALCLQSPVETIEPLLHGGFTVRTATLSLAARYVLLATGGVSYPKTGSVGDGQRMASQLGLRMVPYRPGLVGVEWSSSWMAQHRGKQFKRASVAVYDGTQLIGHTRGLLEIERWGLGGGCISNATRLLSRAGSKHPVLEIRPMPDADPIRIEPVKMRPLKEAMVTVGGIDLAEVSATTCESARKRGLFLAGEVLDIDGPTGGYNLTAAFATARLAVAEIGRRLGKTKQAKDRGREPSSQRLSGKSMRRGQESWRQKRTSKRPNRH
jgi:predicted flavoprotein YhiN